MVLVEAKRGVRWERVSLGHYHILHSAVIVGLNCISKQESGMQRNTHYSTSIQGEFANYFTSLSYRGTVGRCHGKIVYNFCIIVLLWGSRR